MAFEIDWETLMKFNKMFYLTFLLLNLACSPPVPTLPGVREMLDGSAVIKAEDWYKIDSLPKLKLPEPSSNSNGPIVAEMPNITPGMSR